jgi:hypothetical protein
MESIGEGVSLVNKKSIILNQMFNLKHACFIYLMNKGYNMPLYFTPKHWANAKTPIELGIAIDRSSITKQLK